MKITLYTTANCQFSKQEKEYLASHSLPFEEKNLDTNKEFLTEMMTVGNNFAGTPVTKIEKDDGTIVVLKGFTETEFNTALGFAEPPKTEEAKPADVAAEPQPMIKADEPVATQAAPAVTPPAAEDKPAVPAVPQQPAQEPPLDDVLSKLQTNIDEAQKAVSSEGTAAPATPPPAAPVVPETPPTPTETTPSIPDFPADQGAQPAKV